MESMTKNFMKDLQPIINDLGGALNEYQTNYNIGGSQGI
jgi:hypothetical protein